MQIVDDNIYKLIEDETSSFKNFTSNYMVENYKLGVSDVIIRFYKGQLHVMKNGELINNKKIVNVRSKLLAAYFQRCM